ncbi:hypothetical protein [Flavobacterium covae]
MTLSIEEFTRRFVLHILPKKLFQNKVVRGFSHK